MTQKGSVKAGGPLSSLADLVDSRRATIGVFGAGYVGLPLACAFAEAGFKTVAADSEKEKIDGIRRTQIYVEDDYVKNVLPDLVAHGSLEADTDIGHVASKADFMIIAVPTPLNTKEEPDLTSVISVCETIAPKLRLGRFVILESSVYPGATEEVVRPILERGGFKAGKHFGLAYSPERIDYGIAEHTVKRIPKVVAGVTPLCTQIAARLYETIIEAQIVPVSSTRVAEATKMLENTYRYVNIALVNELSMLHEKLGIDFLEVIAAASTKPFGFQAFYPGPGVGGHCIPKDARYLLYKAHQVGLSLKLVEVSTEVNDNMVRHISSRLENRLALHGRTLRGCKATLLGLAFKADVSDVRNSPSISMAENLLALGAEVSAYDPFVQQVMTKRGALLAKRHLESAARNSDILILMTPHSVFREINLSDLHAYARADAILLDTRGFWSPEECKRAGFDYLGLGRPDSE